MSFNGSGTYTLPGAPLASGEIVSSSENNQFRNDVATALNVTMCRDGQSTATANLPMGSHKLTGLSAGTTNGDSVRYEQATSSVAITGGTIDGATIGGVNPPDATLATVEITDPALSLPNGLAVDTDTFVIDVTNHRVGILDAAPGQALSVGGVVESTVGGFKFPDGTTQGSAAEEAKTWTAFTSSGTYAVPATVSTIRAYAFGKGGDSSTNNNDGGGGGGGCAFGDIDVSGGGSVTVTISAGVATVTYGGTTLLTGNPGGNSSGGTGGSGGTASKHASVTNGGAYTGGAGGAGNGGGGSAGSPLGNGYAGGTTTAGGGGGAGGVGGNSAGGGGGAGGAGSDGGGGGGGAGGAAVSNNMSGGIGRYENNAFTDPLLATCFSAGGTGVYNATSYNGSKIGAQSAGDGGGGGGVNAPQNVYGGKGGAFGGGGGAYSGSGTSVEVYGGIGGFGGGGGGVYNATSGTTVGGNGGYGGGGGSVQNTGTSGTRTAGTGGGAIVLIYG